MHIKKLLVSAILTTTAVANASTSKVDQIIDRLENANANRDHVLIVAHRGLWNKNGEA